MAMLTLTVPVAIPNITKIGATGQCDFTSGAFGVLLQLGGGGGRTKTFECTISDTAGQSAALLANATPTAFDDSFQVKPGGNANALTNAQAAYATARGAGTHAAALLAVIQRGLIDGWIDASLAGS